MNIDNPTRLKELTETLIDFSQDALIATERAPLSAVHNTHYRSKLFSITAHINPLVNAAGTLLAIASALQNLTTPPDMTQLYLDLCHEIKAFENKAQAANYRSQNILAARYILCTLIDEIILKTLWGTHSQWKNKNLLITFQNEPWGGERFFVILERCCEDPTLHIDLLELMYISLSMGYEGKYSHLEKGYQQLNIVIDTLYEIIQQQRGEFSQKLFLQPFTNVITNNKLRHWLLPTFICIIATFTLLTIIYISFNHRLHTHAATIFQQLQQLQHFNLSLGTEWNEY